MTSRREPTHVRAVLVARAAANALFAVYLVATAPEAYPQLLEAAGLFAAFDGVLALLSASLVPRLPLGERLWPIPFIEGLVRVGAGLALWLAPGIPYFVLTLVLYVGVIAALQLFVGLLEVAAAGRLGDEFGRNPLSTTLAALGFATATLAAVAFLVDPAPSRIRWLIILTCAAEAIALAAASRQVPQLPETAPANSARAR